MRTNIVLDDELLREARKYSRARTKRALVEEALRALIQVREAERRKASYAERVRRLDQKLSGLVLRESPHDVIRKDRERR